MNYTLHQLKILQTIAQYNSISKAAETLHLSQPAVSIQLKKLQDNFTSSLTEVIGRKLYITDFGKQIVELAGDLIQKAEEIDQLEASNQGQITGKIKITSVSTGKYVMPYLLTDFFSEHESVNLELTVTNKEQVILSMDHNEVDYALVSITPDPERYLELPLLKNVLFLVAPYDYPSKKRVLSPQDLHNLPLIYREKGSGTRQTMEAYLLKHNILIKPKLELSSNEAVKQSVMAGLGLSIMPLIGLKQEIIQKQLKIIPLKGMPVETLWRLIWPKSKKHSLAAQAYLDYIAQQKDMIFTHHFQWYKDFLQQVNVK